MCVCTVHYLYALLRMLEVNLIREQQKLEGTLSIEQIRQSAPNFFDGLRAPYCVAVFF